MTVLKSDDVIQKRVFFERLFVVPHSFYSQGLAGLGFMSVGTFHSSPTRLFSVKKDQDS